MHLLEISDEVISGIEKAVAIYYDEGSNSIVGKITEAQTADFVDDLYLSDYSLINKLRSQSIEYSWHTADNLPFETIKENKVQLNIFDELNNVVLCLAFNNECDNKKDLIFLYLDKNKTNFGIAHSGKPLSTNEKNMIGQLIYKSFQIIFKQQLKDRITLITTNKRIANLQSQNEQLKEEIRKLNSSSADNKIKVTNDVLNTLGKNYNIEFSLSDSAFEKISQYNGSFPLLSSSIKNSAINAINTKFGMTSNHIELSEWDIDFQSEENLNDNLIDNVSERYQKTLQLLDKLENAAKVVLDHNKKLTSENVGNACPIPISAPAISDALKNHHKKVRNLIKEYPDRWPIIRTEFRPVKNILLSYTG